MASETITRNDLTAILNSVLPNPADMTPQEVEDFVDSLLGQGSNIADFVVDEGTETASDGTVWNCRKWNSGVAECWCKVLHTITGWTAWYSWYYSRPDTTKFSFPTDFFIDVPIVEASRSSGIAGVLCEEGAPSATQTQQYYLIRPDAPAANGFNLDIYAIGKWK